MIDRRKASNRVRAAFQGETLKAQLLRGVSGSIGLKAASMLLGLALAIVLARGLGPEGYGIYAFAFSMVTLLTVPLQMGLPTLLVRETAKYQLREEWGLLKGLLRRASQAVAVTSLVIMTIAALLLWYFADHLEPERQATLAWALVLIPLLSFMSLRAAALRGLRRVVQGQLPEMLIRPGLLLVAVVLTAWLGMLTPASGMMLHGIAAAIAMLASVIFLRRHMPSATRGAAVNYATRDWVRSVLPLSFLAGMQVINSQTDIIMLGVMTSDREVGLYRVAAQGSILVAFGLHAINIVIQPHVSRMYYAGDQRQLQKMITSGARATLAFAMPIALIFIFFGETILEWIFGAEYKDASIALSILALGQLINAFAGPVGLIMNMTGHEIITAKVVAGAAVVNVLLNVLLIPYYGIMGAAVATSLTLLFWNFILWFYIWKNLKLNSTALS